MMRNPHGDGDHIHLGAGDQLIDRAEGAIDTRRLRRSQRALVAGVGKANHGVIIAQMAKGGEMGAGGPGNPGLHAHNAYSKTLAHGQFLTIF